MICPDRCTMELIGTYRGIKINEVYRCKWCTVTSYRSVEVIEQERIEQLEEQLHRVLARNLELARQLAAANAELERVRSNNSWNNSQRIDHIKTIQRLYRELQDAKTTIALASPAADTAQPDPTTESWAQTVDRIVPDMGDEPDENLHPSEWVLWSDRARIRRELLEQQPAPATEPVDAEPLKFTYRNWKGELSLRSAVPRRVYFGSTEYHKEPQWLMEAFDADKQAVRTFAMLDMDIQAQPAPATEPDPLTILAERQEPLGAEFAQVLHDNLDHLYVTAPTTEPCKPVCDCIEQIDGFYTARCECRNSGDYRDAILWCEEANRAAQSEPAQAEPVEEDSRVFAGHAVIFTEEDSIVSVFSTKEAAEGDLRTWELAYGSAFKVEPVTLVEAAPKEQK